MDTLRAVVLAVVLAVAIPVVALAVFVTGLFLLVTELTWRLPAFLDSY